MIDEDDNELHSIQQLQEQFDFKNKNPNQIMWILDDSLYERQKESISKLTSLEQEVDKVMLSLDKLDLKYLEFQGIVEANIQNLNALTKETNTIECYSNILELRIKNQNSLQNCLQMMLRGVELTPQEKKILTDPNFDSEDQLMSSEKVLEKVSNFLKFQNDKSGNIRAIREQVSKIQEHLNVFIAKFRDHLKKMTKKQYQQALADELDDIEEKNTLKLVNTSAFRKQILNFRRLVILLFECLPEIQNQLIIEIGLNLQVFINASCANLETIWTQQMPALKLYQSKITFINASDKVSLNNQNNQFIEIIRDIKKFDFSQIVASLLNQIKRQVEADENFWLKFFQKSKDENENQKLERTAMTSQFLNQAYKNLFKKINDLFLVTAQHSQLIIYFIEQGLQNTKESQQDDEDDNQDSKQSVSYINCIQGITDSIKGMRQDIVKTWESYLKGSDYNTRHCGVLPPIKNFTICIRLVASFIGDKNGLNNDIPQMYAKLMEWLKNQASKKQKYHDIVMLTNQFQIYYELDKIKLFAVKEVNVKSFHSYKSFSKQYCEYLFCYQFMKFCDNWFKIKDLKPSELESQKFNKNSFLKSISSTFNNFNKSMDSIIKRMNKHLVKNSLIVNHVLVNFKEYLNIEYQEIEQFCQKVMGSKPNPNKQQLLDVVEQRIDKKLLEENQME